MEYPVFTELMRTQCENHFYTIVSSKEIAMKKFYYSNMLLIYLAVMVCLQPLGCLAQWSSNSYSNTVVCIEDGGQGGTILATDGNGGAIIAWSDDRNGYSDVYAQRFNADGVAQWTGNGISICNAVSYQNLHAIISDGAGGAIIAWTDFRNVDFGSNDAVVVIDIFAQRVNGSGLAQWASNGISISRPVTDVSRLVMATDNNGGAIISWMDGRHEVYAQGINANGTLKWQEKVIATDVAVQVVSPAIVSDGSGGAIITWSDYRNQADQTRVKVQVHLVVALQAAGVGVEAARVEAERVAVGNNDLIGLCYRLT